MVSIRRAWRLGALPTKSLTGPSSWLHLPGQIDTSKVGDGSTNSAVEATLSTLSNAVAEPPIGVASDDGIDLDHRAAKLLARPSEWMRGTLLTRHIIVAMNVATHAILWKQRSAAGRVVGLIPLPPTMAAAGDGTSELASPEERKEHSEGTGATITHFEYLPPGNMPIRLETSEVVYLRQDVDPDDMKAGRSKLASAISEILTDEEAAGFAAALLSNMGVPGVVLVPELEPGEPGPSEVEADAVAESFFRRFSGSRRGRPLMMTGRVKPHVLSFNPDQMNFEALRRIPEERISAVLGVPALLAGLGAGLDSATYSNARELREFFTEQTVAPLWNLLAEEYSYQLLPDFTGDTEQRMAYDLENVAALQEDRDALWTRNLAAAEAGTITVAEFREAVGLPELLGTNIFLRPFSLLEQPADLIPADDGPPEG